MTPHKKIVLDTLLEFDVDAGNVRVMRGRGTARHWIIVTSTKSIDENIKDVIKAKLHDAGILHYYTTDYNVEYSCISFSANNWIDL